MLTPDDVGHRVVVRRIVGIRDDRPLYTDAIGELTELTETDLTLATARGPLRVPLRDVHRAKRVPARRRPTRDQVVALELAANEAWPAPEQERLGEWLLRAADGWTGRGNSALPVGDPGLPLGEAVDAVERWYAARGQRPMINVPLPLASAVNAELDARGWSVSPAVLVQTAPLGAILDATADRTDVPTVRLEEAPSPRWLALAAGRKGSPPGAARHLLTAVREVRFAHVYAESVRHDLLAAARGTVTGGGRWLGLALVEVVPAARRQGLARHAIRGLTGWALGLGATDAFLQVEDVNAEAVDLYRRLGFKTHHRYVTRTAPARGVVA
ncbi:MAG TPA: GNAT family N-acetyltransferase [Micromonosporaceae bacterium]|nr:GNAT family N-acetyltransferase [Micromonosporaceae bacterium]